MTNESNYKKHLIKKHIQLKSKDLYTKLKLY